ncbi:hypothetical protein M427DRAFT_54463 [Gonapodya prolifera JEL478]|uniref:NAP-domain-containing protein n=1 Tax=Gonapodya prolifera (strain JEL478) TaxID=1344416 RepID=A0A139ALA1_GONPJ|nr:hypothetical protein M427DRAFT_54463 [Gonapodya prolifera JEL478]|eukprot:KXS17520.1 hypothetical protein M427DRAFT_54463 [Gonapodya prolifera JEL478]
MSAAKKQKLDKEAEAETDVDPKIEAVLTSEQTVIDALVAMEADLAKVRTKHFNTIQPALEKRDAAIKALGDKDFWHKAVITYPDLKELFMLSPRDAEALDFLTGVQVKREKDDYRKVSVTFTFGKGNTLFKNASLTKAITVDESGEPSVTSHPTIEWHDAVLNPPAKAKAGGSPAAAGKKRKQAKDDDSDDDDDDEFWSTETSAWSTIFDPKSTDLIQSIADELYINVARYALIGSGEDDDDDDEMGDDDADDVDDE